jgi:hypothetical protein
MLVVIYMCTGLRTLDSCPDIGQPSQLRDLGKNVRASTNGPTVKEGNMASLLLEWERDGPLHISIGNTLAAQVCFCLAITARIIMWMYSILCTKLILLFPSQVKNKPFEPTEKYDFKCILSYVQNLPFYFLCRLKINHTSLLKYAFSLNNGAVANNYCIHVLREWAWSD